MAGWESSKQKIPSCELGHGQRNQIQRWFRVERSRAVEQIPWIQNCLLACYMGQGLVERGHPEKVYQKVQIKKFGQ